MEMVETNILVACKVLISLQSGSFSPRGQYFDKISANVKGIVTKHNNKSEIKSK